MKKFSAVRRLDEVRRICKERGWQLDSSLYDHAGHDHVKIEWRHAGVSGWALFNTFNGRFFGQTYRGVRFTSDEGKHDHKPWFNALLNMAYTKAKPVHA